MNDFLRKMERFAKNPHLEALVGIIILATGIVEAGDSIVEDIGSGKIGAHHGMIVLGCAHAFKALPAVLGGMAIFAHAEKRE